MTMPRGFGMGRMMRGGQDEGAPRALKVSDRRMLRWFYQNLGAYWPRLLLGVTAMLGATAAGLAIPLVLKDIFDKVILARDTAPLPGLTLRFLGLTLAALGLGAVRTTAMHLLGQHFVLKVRMDCYRHLMTLGLDFFADQRSGDLMSRISNDVGAVEDLVVHASDDVISNVLHVAGSAVLLFVLDWRMALVALAPLPLFVGMLWGFTRYIRPVFNRIRKELGEINARLQERLGGIHVIKAFAREEAESASIEASSRAYYEANCKSIWMWSTFFPLLSLVTTTGLVVLVWYGARRAATGTALTAMSTGTIIAFLRYMQDFYRPVGALARVQNVINRSLAAVARIFELLDTQPTVRDAPGAAELPAIRGRVEIAGVAFGYATGEAVLRDISVTAEPGEVVALVGNSGAGKTTLVNLIARFHDPAAGAIYIDGIDIRQVTQRSLRRQIGTVLQETFLFNTTVRENILYARPDASEEALIAAARGAHAHAFIEKLPDGYETVIGERGVRLSGGERQRIAIARAFLADPRILILDEATSMVDTEAELVIQQALRELMQGRTTFIIAHRLSTIRQASQILVIEDGRIIERGSHDQLMRRDGRYRAMISRQFQQVPELS
ncbi:MAG: ABC transporter ATP-binding protein [Lentisphaerae bacterium]|nr:ABC transporter ATP-binding protein [Lentisphaerota bacterium]